MNPKEEGRYSFIMGEPEDACSYVYPELRRDWHIGYYKEELNALKQEQERQLYNQDIRYNVPYTGLEQVIENVQERVQKLERGEKIIII